MKPKVFKDPVHGYISVEEDIVDLIIDSRYFQRLRRIEQTSMRCVYPSARHDRFAHSLGTYYLAKVATDAVKKTAMGSSGGTISPSIQTLTFNFEMAALLHDIGHSPMSHTLEKFFEDSEPILKILIGRINDQAFKDDLITASPSPHEIVSCIIVWDCFGKVIETLCAKNERGYTADLEFIVRCIVGAVYHDTTQDMYYKNALIRLLNSGAIDVDKLDYIKRDSIVSGYDSIAIDTHRLLNSLTAVPLIDEEDGAFTLAFGKSALSVVQNVVDCRNMLYTWTYGHHKVVYESDYLLKKAVTKIIESDKEKLPELFSIDAIKTRLCCDDDIWVFLKKYPDIPEVAELLDRSRHRIALWKSRVEFDLLFPRNEKTIAVGNFDVSLMIREIKAWDAGDAGRKAYESFCEYVDTEYAVKGASNVAVFISPKTKAKIIMPNDVYIEIGGELYRYTSLEAVAEKLRDSVFAYVYISENSLKIRYKRRLRSNKYEFTKCFVEYIKKYQKFCLQPDFSR